MLLVTALRAAIRTVMRNGAITCASQSDAIPLRVQNVELRNNRTDLNPGDNYRGDEARFTPRQYQVHQEGDGVRGTRLGENNHNCCVHSGNSGRNPQCSSNRPAVQHKSYDNHKCQEDIQRKAYRCVWQHNVAAVDTL